MIAVWVRVTILIAEFLSSHQLPQFLIHLDEVVDNISALLHGVVDRGLLLQEVGPEQLAVDLLRSVLLEWSEAPGQEYHLEQPVEGEVAEK